MADASLTRVVHHIRKLAGGPDAEGVTDGQLLRQFVARRDEAAFQALMERHGPMVLGVGRRVLRHGDDAEDVFQATFLLLAQKAGSIRKPASVGSWLHGVARRLAVKARLREEHRRQIERQPAPDRQADPGLEAAWREVRTVLDEEFQRLPPKYRDALILCCLEGHTHEEAARRLGRPLGTVKSLLSRGRDLLRARLARRGLALSAAAFAALLVAHQASAAVPAALLAATGTAAVLLAAGRPAGAGVIPAEVAALLEGVSPPMIATKLRLVPVLLLLAGVLGVGAVLLAHQVPAGGPRADDTKAPAADLPPAPPARADRLGDPLPPDALVRMGTVRLRHRGSIRSVAFAPDGKLLASAGDDDVVRFWDPVSGREVRAAEKADGAPAVLAFAPDGKTLAGAAGKAVSLWDAGTGKAVRKLAAAGPVAFVGPVAFAADGTTLAVAAKDNSIHVWDLATGAERQPLPAAVQQVTCLAFAPDGKTLVSAGRRDLGGVLQVWDPAAGKELRTVPLAIEGSERLRPLALSPGGETLALERAAEARRPTGTGTEVFTEYQVVLLDTATGKERLRLEPQRDVIWTVAFAPDGKTVAWMGMDDRVDVADAGSGKLLRRLEGYPGGARPDGLTTLAFSGDGKTLAAVGDSAAVHVWDLTTGRERVEQPEAHHNAVTALAYSADSRTLVSGSADRTLRLWDPATGRQVRALPRQAEGVLAVALSPDGRTLASATWGSVISLWDPATGRKLRQLEAVRQGAGASFAVCPVAFTPDGKELVSWGDDRRLHRWDAATGKELAARPVNPAGLPPAEEGRPKDMPAFADQVGAVVFRPDAKVAAVAARSSISLVDTATGYELMRLPGQAGPCSLAFSPDGKLLVSGGWDKAVRLWETATGKEVFRVEGLDFVNAVAFAPDGRRVAAATGWADGVIHVFEVPTGKELLRLRGHGSFVGALAFAADGKTLASGQRDTTVLVWDVTAAPAKPPARELSPGNLDRLWADLAAADARTGQSAVWALAAAPAQAVPFLKEHVAPAVPADPKHIDRLIADLDGEEFAVRDAAARELRALGAEAEPALRRALQGKPSAEARKRIEALLAGPPVGAVPPPEVLRRLRAVQVLEQIGSPEARSVLEGLARGAPAAVETREAAAALERLARRPDQPC